MWCCSACQRPVCGGAGHVDAVFLLYLNTYATASHTAAFRASWYKKEAACDGGLLNKRADEERDPGFCAPPFPAPPPPAEPLGEYLLSITYIVQGHLSHCKDEDKNLKNSFVSLFLTIKCLSLKVSFSFSIFLK